MRGYFGIGIFGTKTEINVGTLWRSAYQFGASFIFTIAHRYKSQSSDTTKSWRHIPLIHFADYESFEKSNFHDCSIVCIEFNQHSKSLIKSKHPERCIYLLGAEDNGLPEHITNGKQTIEIPSIRQQSFNVAVAGSIVMYDRYIKKEEK